MDPATFSVYFLLIVGDLAMSEFRNDMKSRAKDAIALMADGLIDRDPIIEVVLLTALAGEHSVLLGPPGVAKSQLARRLALAIDLGSPDRKRDTDSDSRIPGYVEFLLTSFTKPDEILGPLDIKALKNSCYSRQTSQYLPGTHEQPRIAFLDEIFKANSAILNALLTLLNEGHYDNGAVRVIPSWFTVIAASNELPGGASDDDESSREAQVLGALYDRFLTRVWVTPLQTDGDVLEYFQTISRNVTSTKPGPPLRIADIASAYKMAQREVTLPMAVQLYLLSIRKRWHEFNEAYIGGQLAGTEKALAERRRVPPLVSDRRWGKIIKLMKVAAWYDGRDYVSVRDTFVLPYLLPTIQQDAIRLFDPSQSHSSLGYRDWSILAGTTVDFPAFAQSPPSQREMTASLEVANDLLDLLQDDVKQELPDARLWNAIASETLDDGDWASSSNTQALAITAFRDACQLAIAAKQVTASVIRLQPILRVKVGQQAIEVPFVELQRHSQGSDWISKPLPADRRVFLAATCVSERLWDAVMAHAPISDPVRLRRQFTQLEIDQFLNHLHQKATLLVNGTPAPMKQGTIVLPTYSMWQHTFTTGQHRTLADIKRSIEVQLGSERPPVALLEKDERRFEREYAKCMAARNTLIAAPEFYLLLGDQHILRTEANEGGHFCSAGLTLDSLNNADKVRWTSKYNVLRLALTLDL